MTNKDIDVEHMAERFIKLSELEADVLSEMKRIFNNKDKEPFGDVLDLLVDWLKFVESLQNKGVFYLMRSHEKLGHSEPIIKWLEEAHRLQDKNFDHLINIHELLDNDDLTSDGLKMQENSEKLADHCENLLDEVFVIEPRH